MLLGLGAFAPISAFADSYLVKDGYFYFENPTYLYASEEITVVGENSIYVITQEGVNVIDKKAEKAISENGNVAYLALGQLFIDNEMIAQNVVDFAFKNGRIVYVDTNGVYLRNSLTSTETSVVCLGEYASVALSGNGIYLRKDMGAYDNVYFVDGLTNTAKIHAEYAKKFDYLIFDTKLWGATENTLYDFSQKITVSPYANAVSVYNGVTYYLADGCLYKDGELLLGAGKDFYFLTKIDSNANGFYVTDYNGIYSINYSDKKKTLVSNLGSNVTVSSLPSSTAYYVIDSDVYCGNEVLYSIENTITDIVCDGDGNLYFSTNEATYKNGETLYEIGGMLAIAPAKNSIYNYQNGTVYKNGVALEKTVEPAIAFDVDCLGNIYVLTETEIIKYATDGSQSSKAHNLFEAVDIDICYEKNTLGQIAVVDKKAHNVVFVDGLDVALPSLDFSGTPDTELIRKTLCATTVFADLNKTETITTLSASTSVICSAYNLESNDFLAYVSFKNGNKLVTGFVEKAHLSDVITGGTPRYEQAKTVYDNVILHSHPYSLQEAINNAVIIIPRADETLNLLSKYTVFGEDWYKAEYGGQVGYVNAEQIQLGNYIPTVRPKTNAKLIKISYVYDKENGKYIEDEIYLEVGTEVEVLGIFDSNTDYTQIKYYDKEAGGTRTCYVKTDSIKYDHITFEQQFALIAVIILSVTMILVVIIFIRHKHKRKY